VLWHPSKADGRRQHLDGEPAPPAATMASATVATVERLHAKPDKRLATASSHVARAKMRPTFSSEKNSAGDVTPAATRTNPSMAS